jgi:hypothetical protein
LFSFSITRGTSKVGRRKNNRVSENGDKYYCSVLIFADMSMTITLCKEDEEHTLSIDPGDNFIEILTKILGNVNNCTFTIDGKNVSSINNLSKELHNNARMEVSSYRTRGAPVSLGPRGFPWELKSQKNPSRPVIKIETVHISCSSDSYDANQNMAGLIVYSFDNQQMFELNGHRCRTGYILIKATKNIEHVKSSQGIVHGSLFKWFFGIEPDHRFVGAGFALYEKKYKFNSGTFNARNDDYHDDSNAMTENEISLIKHTLNELYVNDKWKQNPTLSVQNIGRNPYNPGDCLPIQNHPRSTMN